MEPRALPAILLWWGLNVTVIIINKWNFQTFEFPPLKKEGILGYSMEPALVTRNADSSHPPQGDGGVTSTEAVAVDQLQERDGNTVFKSGPLFISSKGIGWTSWKKRWFILTKTSLVFLRSDPNSQRGSEVNLTLGGIDLNSSGSVVVRADRKLLTVLFPDGHDGRGFTLKAETLEDMYEWKTALENALAQAPSGPTPLQNTMAQAPNASLLTGESGISRDDASDGVEGLERLRDRQPAKSLVVGRPVLLALEDHDGTPSFLEKALRFIEQYGVKVEGIFRQAADVDEVERRIQEFEHGRNEFSPDEDAHVIADCIKHILRELPSSPISASCCSSLLEAFKTTYGSRVHAMHSAIFEDFPEPNRRLLKRILKMMRTVVYHKSENLMSTSAVAACMAPVLLRPLLAGECEVENDFNMGGDGSFQLMQAAAAANHAQAIVIILLGEFKTIFSEGSFSPKSYSKVSGSEDEVPTDDELLEDDEYHVSDLNREIEVDLDSEIEDDQDDKNGDDSSIKNDHDEGNDRERGDDPRSKIRGSHSESSGEEGSDLDNSEVRKNLSTESIDISVEDEIAIQRLESSKVNLQNSIAKEAEENAVLQESLERRKQALLERRLALEHEVAQLQEQLQKERDLRAMLEAVVNMPVEHLPVSSTLDSEKATDLLLQLNQQRQDKRDSACESCSPPPHEEIHDHQKEVKTTAKEHCEKPPRSECLPKLQQLDLASPISSTSMGAATNLFIDCVNLITRKALFLSKNQPTQTQRPDLTSNNSTKFTEETSSSTCCENVITQNQPSSSKKLQSYLASHKRTRSTGTIISSFTNHENVLTQDYSSSLNKPPLQKQQTDSPSHKKQIDSTKLHKSKSRGPTGRPSTDSQNDGTQDPSSLSNKQNPNKLQPDLVGENSSKSTNSKRISSTEEPSKVGGGVVSFLRRTVGRVRVLDSLH
ncbi:hypothetical protein AAC387_Pa11g1400 [Persea americana]